MQQRVFDEETKRTRSKLAERWRENRGNFLLAFFVGILIVGASVILYEQNRFVPVRFPEGNSIESADEGASPADEGGRRREIGSEDVTELEPVDGDAAREPALPVHPSAMLSIEIAGAESDAGAVMVAIYHAADAFNRPDEAIMKRSLPVKNKTATWRVPLAELPGKFAVAAYHDKDGDESLGRNAIGIPNERYGFSRGARSLTGPPAFTDAVMERPTKNQSVRIGLR